MYPKNVNINSRLLGLVTILLYTSTPFLVGQVSYIFEDYDSFANHTLRANDDTVYVVNFWATWCKPCIRELPFFEKLNKKYQDRVTKVTLVSLDFPDQIESKLLPFIRKHDLKSEVVVFAASKPNSWIPKIHSSWSGAIPFTLIFNNNKKFHYEKEFTSFVELEEGLLQLLKN